MERMPFVVWKTRVSNSSRKGCPLNAERPPPPVPVGSPACTMKPGTRRWKAISSKYSARARVMKFQAVRGAMSQWISTLRLPRLVWICAYPFLPTLRIIFHRASRHSSAFASRVALLVETLAAEEVSALEERPSVLIWPGHTSSVRGRRAKKRATSAESSASVELLAIMSSRVLRFTPVARSAAFVSSISFITLAVTRFCRTVPSVRRVSALSSRSVCRCTNLLISLFSIISGFWGSCRVIMSDFLKLWPEIRSV
mmetsp:Transcript_24144/g.53689  ORF Transcript_24144/g.53689 Transcript_24144/m.53689 type:complete len:255 (-) Transcript_24144:547-1311(-)